MKKVASKKRKVSAIVALALAALVTFTAGIQSYGIPKNEGPVVFDIDGSLERAYDEFSMEEFTTEFEAEDQQIETINIYDQNDNLIKSIELKGDEVVEDLETKKLLNKADFLTSYNKTSHYKIN